MKIIIVGCGKIGLSVLRRLINEGHDVVAIDKSPEIIEEISTAYDAMCVVGNGADSDILEEAGAGDAELVVAVTGVDELNMLSCFLAKKMGAKHTISRIRTPEYNDKSLVFLKEQLEISMALNPDSLAADELYKMLKLPGALSIDTFSRRSFEMIEIRLHDDSPFDGMTLMEIRKKFDAKFLVCTVQREDEVFIPDGNFVLRSGDKINFTAQQTEVLKLFGMLGLNQKQAKSVMIIGASRIAFYLAKQLIASGSTVKIVEQNREVCEKFASLLPQAIVIHGDGAKHDLLLEEGLLDTDAFITLTGMDEENILLAFYAASHNVPQVISKVNKPELVTLATTLGIDSIVSPIKIVSDIHSRYARALDNSLGSSVETLYKLCDGKAEALEFNVTSEFEYCDIPLKSLAMKKNTLICGIIRGRKNIIPNGDDVILPGDSVVVIAEGAMLSSLAEAIEGKR
ncbi:MAG: Trk system potassium transporter TrkA [Clostridia bacterium]|nr:Trk system potassium transporter TrkA [Clostridia bacterium]